VLGHSLVYTLVDGEECFTGSPVHLADELTAKCVDNTGHRRRSTLANEVEVQHTLDSSWLQAIDEASCLVVEECVLCARAQWSTGSSETANIVIHRQSPAGSSGSCAIGTIWHCGRHRGYYRAIVLLFTQDVSQLSVKINWAQREDEQRIERINLQELER
jgi:hypothetical protein